jgi:hypothetical protein
MKTTASSQLADSMSAIGLKTPITVRAIKRDVDRDNSDAIPDLFAGRRRRADGERDAQAFETLKAAWAEASDAVRCRFRKEVLATEAQVPAAIG